MGKRKRIPSPFDRITLPTVIRKIGPYFILVTSGGVVLLAILIAGGSYILSRVDVTQKTSAQKAPSKVDLPISKEKQKLNAAASSTGTTENTSTANAEIGATSGVHSVPNKTQSTNTVPATVPVQNNTTNDTQADSGQNAASDANTHAKTSTQVLPSLGPLSINISIGL